MATYALAFIGTNRKVLYPSTPTLFTDNNFELELEFSTYDITARQALLVCRDGVDFAIEVFSGAVRFTRYISGHSYIITSPIVNDTVYKVRVVVTPTGRSIYLDDVLEDSDAVSSLGTPENGEFASGYNQVVLNYGLKGELHYVKVTNNAVPSKSRYYPFNEGTGVTLVDTLGDGSTDGTYINPPASDAQWVALSAPVPAASVVSTQASQNGASVGSYYPAFVTHVVSSQAAQSGVSAGTFSPPAGTVVVTSTQAPQTSASAGVRTVPVFTGNISATQAAQGAIAVGTSLAPVDSALVTSTQASQSASSTGEFTFKSTGHGISTQAPQTSVGTITVVAGNVTFSTQEPQQAVASGDYTKYIKPTPPEVYGQDMTTGYSYIEHPDSDPVKVAGEYRLTEKELTDNVAGTINNIPSPVPKPPY